jgi:hypothetical protein
MRALTRLTHGRRLETGLDEKPEPEFPREACAEDVRLENRAADNSPEAECVRWTEFVGGRRACPPTISFPLCLFPPKPRVRTPSIWFGMLEGSVIEACFHVNHGPEEGAIGTAVALARVRRFFFASPVKEATEQR